MNPDASKVFSFKISIQVNPFHLDLIALLIHVSNEIFVLTSAELGGIEPIFQFNK